jgi:xanthine dehydrogenase accessory factor
MLSDLEAADAERRERVREVVEALLSVLTGGGQAALATVVRTSGSTPQKPGARMLLFPDGRCVGTVGGGAIEHVVALALRETLETGEAQIVARELSHDLGMCCGGRMEVFVERVEAAPRLWLIGAGHVARPTAALARTVGFEVTVVDDREEYNTEERFPGCKLEILDPASLLRGTALGEADWILIATHDHALDEKVLGLVMEQSPRYVGLVASRRKALRLVQRVAAKGRPVDLGRLYAPVGLDLGAVTPEELAVSIVGELVALRRGKAAAHLRSQGDLRLVRSLEEAGR